MTDDVAIDETSVTERLVLHELAVLQGEDRTPAQAPELLTQCRGRLEDLDEVAGGRLTEADLLRACRALDEQGFVAEIQGDETSPVGKGRPSYELSVEPDTVYALVRDDERFDDISADDTSS